MDIDKTTPLIERVLGVPLTLSEVKALLIQTEEDLRRQSPYLDTRLLFRRDKLIEALGGTP